MSDDELVTEVHRALSIARQAMEQDASEARSRGWGVPAPDSASVGTLAAGILIAGAISREREKEQQSAPEPTARTRATRRSSRAA